MAYHSKRSPSRAKQVLACAGSIALCDALPEIHKNISGEAAMRGTATHGLVERTLKERSAPADYMDRIIELVGDEQEVSILKAGAKLPGRGRVFFIVDSDMIESADCPVDYIRKRCEELGLDQSALQLETRTNPLPEKPMEETSGTADVTLDAWPELLEVVDFKNGYLVVDHEDNEQTMAYLLGKAIETGFTHEKYMVTICQPNAPHPEGRIRSVTYTAKELKAFHKRYLAGVNRSEEADDAKGAPKPGFNQVNEEWAKKWLVAGQDHCFWCDAKPVCPAHLAMAQAQAGVDFEDEPAALDEPSCDEDAARILMWAPMLENLIKSAHLYGQRTLEAGFKFSGHKLVRGKTNREFRDDIKPEKLADKLVAGGYIKNKKVLFTAPKMLTAPAVEKLVPKDKRKAYNEKFVVKPEGRLTMVREDDPREAVEANPGADFEELDNDADEFE